MDCSLCLQEVHAKALGKNKDGAFRDKVEQHSCSTWREDKVMIHWFKKAQQSPYPPVPEADSQTTFPSCLWRRVWPQNRGPASGMWRKWGAPNPKEAAVLPPILFPSWPTRQRWSWRPRGRGSPRMEGVWAPQENHQPTCNVCLGCCVSEKWTSTVFDSYIFESIYSFSLAYAS